MRAVKCYGGLLCVPRKGEESDSAAEAPDEAALMSTRAHEREHTAVVSI